MVLLTLPNDIAAFSVFNGHPGKEFERTYSTFRRLYHENNREWDERTLSFVVCRSSEDAEDDRFYASLENDPLFCRKYVIRAHDEIAAQRGELLRLPFLPLRTPDEDGLQRPQSAQDFLQSAGISASLSRKLIEAGHRSAERIAVDLRDGDEKLPETLTQPRAGRMTLTRPRAHSRLVSLAVEGFRAYRDLQKFDLDASVVVLYGPNGLGKTSLFDAIDYASTGRIGRLCSRQKRSQTEFSRIATHLDKTPGSGSVVLTVRGDVLTASPVDRKLQRSTGNWSTAWLDGEEVDRKTVINTLAQANWLEASPRQQTLESLFRATHLFGQDEQELLTNFQKGSVIPEAFISEMLALQDYSQGLSKVTDVLAQLTGQRSAINEELTQLRTESNTLTASLPEIPSADSDISPLPIEGAIADLRQKVLSAGIKDALPSESSSLATFSEWLEIISARLAAADDYVRLAHTLRDELPAYQRFLEESTLTQKQLGEVDRDLENGKLEEQEITRRLDVNETTLNDAQASRRQREQKRRDLRVVLEIQAERHDLSKQIVGLQTERDQQALELSQVGSRLVATESALSTAMANHAEAERAVASVRSDLADIQRLLEDFPQIERDTAVLVDVKSRLDIANRELQSVTGREIQATKELQDTTRSREALLPEYERALAEQAELEKLLDSIQIHLHDKSCPLCGSQFDSLDALSQRIRHQRNAVSQEKDVTVRYKSLVAQEARELDFLRIAKTDVTATKASIKELSGLLNATEQRLAHFRDRLRAYSDENPDTGSLRQRIVTRQKDLKDRSASLAQKAESTSKELKNLQTSQAQEATRRRAATERITALERGIKELTDRISGLAARTLQVLPADLAADVDLESEVSQTDRSIDEVMASIEQLQIARQGELEKRETFNARKRSLSEKREALLSKLGELNQSITGFRKRLRRLDLQDNVNLESLDRAVRQEDRRTEAVRDAFEKGRVIVNALQARQARLQLLEKQAQLDAIRTKIAKLEGQFSHIGSVLTVCDSIEKLLKRERQSAIERHIAAYGPMITLIQQRLRSVYGFGGIHLEAHGGEATVQVEWRNKSVQVPPTDFFSDSQRQILMLSIFLAGGLRQNWSGFAPMLLDDPVTHFDDLNAYGFVELVRGIISTSPNEWQFIISTCEERLFALMQKKFSRLPSGAIFYEFLGMSERGPLIERR
jgi:exonuclease SbcC